LKEFDFLKRLILLWLRNRRQWDDTLEGKL